jgi:hypothetical protein
VQAERASESTVKMFARVTVDGRRGTVIGFYARDERIVLIRLDAGGLIEVPEPRLVREQSRIEVGRRASRGDGGRSARARHAALTRSVDLGTSAIDLR